MRYGSTLTSCFVAIFWTVPALADVETGVALLNDGDVAGAATEFAAAYEAGDGEGAFYLGRLFELGLGTEQDEMRAANLYSAAAESGSTKAQVRLGLMYHEGRVLLRDYVEGTRLLCAAADAGDPDGQLNCGLAYRAGRGVAQDDAVALSYWQGAAGQGNILAMNVLGQTSIDAGNLEQAAQYLKQSADLGNAGGMYEYAKLLMIGASPDPVTAYSYANLAVVRGLADAGILRDEIEAELTAEEIAEGQALARAWTEARILEEEAADGN
ncbi:tetratricopeptide repeat protein [Cognatiyoonia sp. IB215446]|uniref:tetratricopeptide repeat protein n=1 Tax=Cognatiyoonia sp. IB215446 TaxID=3097355 RepID=UPI002A0E832E|nr:tetratricopeptide repeat protein [Cognatiyoonia sp. IB215446]MDX8350523.1 tetratricopeptide repeat protein [Cognatiyoonia sp. IB215446]